MFTYKQFRKARRKLTQAQRAQLPPVETAKKFVMQAIEEALAVHCLIPEGLREEDLDRIFDDQPMHFDALGYMPHYFQRQDIQWWGKELCHYYQLTKPGRVQHKSSK